MKEEKKRSDIIIDGIPEDQQESLERTVTQLLTDIGVNPQPGQIVTAFRLGTVKQVNKPKLCPILVKLSSPNVKFHIYKHVKNLKDNDKWTRVFISDDLPREVAEERKILRCLAATARDRGHRASVRRVSLIVDDMRYMYKEIEDLPQGINMENAKMVQVKDGIALQSHRAYLSSMYPVQIKIGDTPIHCAEQAYWYTMAKTAGNKKIMQKVHDAKNGYDAKKAGHLLKMTKELEESKKDNMEDVQDLKFEQNPNLKKKLMTTKGNLYEATMDIFFGCGLLLSEKPKFGTVKKKDKTGLD